MKITTTENGEIQLEEVYNPIVLKTRDGEVMAITMRDTGFELNYQGKWYSAKQGVIEPFDMNEAKSETKQSDTPDEEERQDLKTEVFMLANKLAISGEGDAAVRMHRICNSL